MGWFSWCVNSYSARNPATSPYPRPLLLGNYILDTTRLRGHNFTHTSEPTMCKLDEARFQNDDAAREYLEATVWPHGPVCPHCGTIGTAYKTSKTGLYRCAEAECRSDFTVTVGTVFERSKIALHKWLLAAHLVCSSKKGMSSH